MASTEHNRVSDAASVALVEVVPSAPDPVRPPPVPDPPSPVQDAQQATLTHTGADPPPGA